MYTHRYCVTLVTLLVDTMVEIRYLINGYVVILVTHLVWEGV